MAQEKLDELRCVQEMHGCAGCSPDCSFDIKQFQDVLVKKYGEDNGIRILASCLEWDHHDRTAKHWKVSKIFNRNRRRREIAECQLLCYICHHL